MIVYITSVHFPILTEARQSLPAMPVVIALAVPLGLSLRQIAWESNAAREARDVIRREFAEEARISQLDIDFDAPCFGNIYFGEDYTFHQTWTC